MITSSKLESYFCENGNEGLRFNSEKEKELFKSKWNNKNMREIYLKIKEKCELPVAVLTYSYTDFEGVVQFGCIHVDLKEDEKNIKRMEAIKKKYAQFFMFFNNSDEGIEFWKNNPIQIY